MISRSFPEKILLEFGVEKPEDIDLEAICFAYGINLHFLPMGKEDAFLFSSNNGAGVDFLINSNRPVERQRFSIGHELGHFFIHKGKNLMCQNAEIFISAFSNKRPNPEREADKFAAELLMPSYLFKPIIQKEKSVNFSLIRGLAVRFQTSLTATLIRSAQINTHEIMIIAHDLKGNRLYYNKSNLIDAWPHSDKLLSSETYAHDVLKSKRPDGGPIPACEWFEDVDSDAEVIEESIFLNNQVLSIITAKDHRLLAD